MKSASILTSVFLLLLFTHCQSPSSQQVGQEKGHLFSTEREDSASQLLMEVPSDTEQQLQSSVSKDEITDDPKLYMDPFDPDFITGRWGAEDFNGTSFETWFYVEDGFVSGQYCAINADASRIDCGTQDEVDFCYVKSPYLVGSKKLELEIVSCYSQKKGRASIEPYGDGAILWTITEAPGEYGLDYFAHESAVLRKLHFDPWED